MEGMLIARNCIKLRFERSWRQWKIE